SAFTVGRPCTWGGEPPRGCGKMNRRQFVSGAVTAGGLALLGGGFWARQVYARSQLQNQLVGVAGSVLAAKEHKELAPPDERAEEEIRRQFDGDCLRVTDFVAEICAPEFSRRLQACADRQQQQEIIVLAFSRNVVTETQVIERVRSLAA